MKGRRHCYRKARKSLVRLYAEITKAGLSGDELMLDLFRMIPRKHRIALGELCVLAKHVDLI